MSGTHPQWGTLMGDVRHIYDPTSLGESEEIEICGDPSAGEWPDSVEIRSYADSSMSLPGVIRPGPTCGDWVPQEFCDECGQVSLGISRCEQRGCPNCWDRWCRERAAGAGIRIGAGRLAEPDGIERRTVHAVVSPPVGSVTTLQDVFDGFREAYERAQEHGVRGGVAIFHGFRVTDEAKIRFKDADPDEGIWRWVRGQPEEWRDLTYWSPHWHVIGLCEDFRENDPDAEGGWVAERIRSLDSLSAASDRDGHADTVRCVRYLLSHATFETDSQKDCVRWFGELATSKFSAESAVSDGVLSVVRREVEDIVGVGDQEDSDGDGQGQECDECESGTLRPIWDAGAALADKKFCDRIGRDRERQLKAAYEWRIGDVLPPPGLRHPSSESEAQKSLEALL